MSDNTPPQDATPGDGSVRGDSILTLTAAEREAVERVSVAYDLLPTDGARQVAATLRGLLERLAAEVERLRNYPAKPDSSPLTAAEREAVRFCTTAALPETEKLGGVAGELCRRHGDTLRALLERLQ
jgi:hypothetical protein